MEAPPAREVTAGFAYRWAASMLDGLVLLPAWLPTTLLVGYGPHSMALAVVVLTAPVAWLYTTITHARWGRTLGKQIVGIHVARADNLRPIGWGAALRRDAPAILFSTLSALLLVRIILAGDTEAFRIFSLPEYEHELVYEEGEELQYDEILSILAQPFKDVRDQYAAYDPLLLAVSAVSQAWFLVEAATMLTNSRRRALHDFIGGTVVVMNVLPDAVTAAAMRQQ